MKQTILCVDDELDNVDALERLFRKYFTVLKAVSGPVALEILKNNPNVAVIISDQRMPDMTGVEFLEKTLTTHPDAIRILLTGYTDIESVIAAVNSGQIYRYLTKPWDPTDLSKTVLEAAEKFKLKSELNIKNKQLEAALIDLKSLDQTKNQFMILINHELKTPLTSILNFAELLGETTITEEQKKYLARITQSAYRLKDMVDDVLKIVAGETGLLKRSFSIVDISTQSFSVWQKTLLELDKKGQQLVFKLNPIKARMDFAIINDIINRLLNNASRFGESNSLITVELIEEPQGYRFKVLNTGQEIPDGTISKILKPFTLNEDIMKHTVGTGLGLSVCQALLKSHNSCLNIKSADKTTEVSFLIPKDLA